MASKYFKRGDVVQVDWGDAYNAYGWCAENEEDCAPSMVTCIAGVVYHNAKGILLTFGFSGKKHIGQMFIPKGMISKLKLLVPTKKVVTSY